MQEMLVSPWSKCPVQICLLMKLTSVSEYRLDVELSLLHMCSSWNPNRYEGKTYAHYFSWTSHNALQRTGPSAGKDRLSTELNLWVLLLHSWPGWSFQNLENSVLRGKMLALRHGGQFGILWTNVKKKEMHRTEAYREVKFHGLSGQDWVLGHQPAMQSTPTHKLYP